MGNDKSYDIIDYIDLESYKNLIRNVGWKILSDKQFLGSLENTTYISAIKLDGEVVALARCVGDKFVHGLLCDVMVLEKHRNKHFGTIVVKDIMKKIKENLNENEEFLLELCPTAGKVDFYKRCGFKYKPDGMIGMYLWIKNI